MENIIIHDEIVIMLFAIILIIVKQHQKMIKLKSEIKELESKFDEELIIDFSELRKNIQATEIGLLSDMAEDFADSLKKPKESGSCAHYDNEESKVVNDYFKEACSNAQKEAYRIFIENLQNREGRKQHIIRMRIAEDDINKLLKH